MMRKVCVSIALLVTLFVALGATGLAAHNEVTFRIFNNTDESHRVTVHSDSEGRRKELTADSHASNRVLNFEATAWWLKRESHRFEVEISQQSTGKTVCKYEFFLVNEYHFFAEVQNFYWGQMPFATTRSELPSTKCTVTKTRVWREHDLSDSATAELTIEYRN